MIFLADNMLFSFEFILARVSFFLSVDGGGAGVGVTGGWVWIDDMKLFSFC